jgi:hypothetical protein
MRILHPSRTLSTLKYDSVIPPSSQHLLHQPAVNLRQAEVAAMEEVGQQGAVEAEQVQDGSVQVVDVNAIVSRVEAEVVAGPERAWFDAAAGWPDREAGPMMIAALATAAPDGRGPAVVRLPALILIAVLVVRDKVPASESMVALPVRVMGPGVTTCVVYSDFGKPMPRHR